MRTRARAQALRRRLTTRCAGKALLIEKSPLTVPFDRDDATRELQLASMPDIQGSIQANDTKSSAALVVHGLLFAGVVSVAANIGDTFETATLGARIAGGVLLAAAASAFGGSVLALIDAARPHDPKSTRDVTTGKQAEAFFPPANPRLRPPGTVNALADQQARLASLQTQADFEAEYAAEQIKLADIRVTQAYAAKRGFALLKLELLFVAVFLLLVALVAVGTPHLAGADERSAIVRLAVEDGDRRLRSSGGGTLRVSGRRPVTVRVLASGAGLERVELVGESATRCARGRGGRRGGIDPVFASEERREGVDRIEVAEVISPARCRRRAGRLRATIHVRVSAGSAGTTRQLVLRAP